VTTDAGCISAASDWGSMDIEAQDNTTAALEQPRPRNARALRGRVATVIRWTTVVLRNLPGEYTRDRLQFDLKSQGFKFDFLYMPMDFQTHRARGYAFVNLLTPTDASHLMRRLKGFMGWSAPASKGCNVSWGDRDLQGLAANIERYRDGSLMHEDVPDSFKPALFQLGVRIPFPAPRKKVRVPRKGAERTLRVQTR